MRFKPPCPARLGGLLIDKLNLMCYNTFNVLSMKNLAILLYSANGTSNTKSKE